MGIFGFLRDQEQDAADPDIRASRYFLFRNKQSDANRLKNAEKKYGYSLADLHAYKEVFRLPELPQLLQKERPELAYEYNQVEKLLSYEGYVSKEQRRFDDDYSPVVASTDVAGGGGGGITPGNSLSEASELDESAIKCFRFFLSLDRCVRSTAEKDSKNRIYKNTRLQICKPHWVWMNRCVNYRDKQFLKEISSWELKHVKSLDADTRNEYVEDLRNQRRYLEYAELRAKHNAEAIKLRRKAKHMDDRLERLRQAELVSGGTARTDPGTHTSRV